MQEYIKFNDKCLEVKLTSDAVIINSGTVLEIRQRIVSVQNAINYSVHSIRSGRKKVIYIRHGGLGSKCKAPYKALDELQSPIAYIKHIKSNLGDFVTIITPGQFLLDYVILSSDIIVVMVSGKREIYFEQSNKNILIMYII